MPLLDTINGILSQIMMVPGWRGLPDGLTNLSFCLTHGVKLSTCLWEDGASAEVESCLESFEISTFLGSGVFTGVCCWSNCEAVYSIGCWNMLWIPWLSLDSLPLLDMVFMLVVSLFNSLQEAMLWCSYMVLVVSKCFLPVQKWKTRQHN